uniref:Putative actinomycin synthetase I adenylation domain protein n=1 Tax=Amycolatopsis sp. SANK 60206 TaxID=1642649 RepID=A0A0E3Z886_9PSEU|nr:putative actinomycin synthetase I adenylation domain protein [Amycolatopsis sp. SANK 60206]
MAAGSSPSWWGERLLGRWRDDDMWILTDRPVTYAELREAVRRQAETMASAGIGAGSSVALRIPPSLTVMYVMLAAWTLGAQVMLVESRSPLFEVERLLRICEPQFLISAPPPPTISRYLAEDVSFTVTARPTGYPAASDVCLVQTSSGSTGEPKVIGRGPGSLLRELYRYTALEGMPKAGERVLLLNSIIHTMGLIGGVLHGLNTGAQMVFPARMRAETMVETARAAGASAILGVPVHFALLGRSADVAVPSLRLAVSAGEALPHAIWTRFHERFGVPISPVYGTTETGVIAGDLVAGLEPPVLGQPAAGIEVEVVEGELRVRMDHTPYLWSDRADRFQDGWLRTFDRVDRDPVSGLLSYRGRADSVVVIGGLKVDLTEVEQTILLHPQVREAVVVFCDVIEAYVGGDAALTAADMANWCRSRLSDYKVPKLFRLAAAVPRNANGKVIRNPEVLRRPEETDAHADH